MANTEDQNIPENEMDETIEETAIVDTILPRPVETEITQSYIDYAMSVIISRALPDVRDGLKPLAQPFSMRYPMVDWQGNFGSVDWDGAAAARYTEAKMTKLAEEMLQDIQLETVDRRPNYDQTNQEPIVVPTKFPYALCNGTMGIAVGMATNMPPHNLTEVLDACLMLLENPEATIDDVMEIVQGPDFPTSWFIFDSVNIKEVYAKGRGWIVMRGKVEFEENKKWGDRIIISELPYQVNKANLVAKIGELVNMKKLEWITDITDETNRERMRISIDLKKWISKEEMLIRLYKYTDLQTNFNVNNVALIERGKQPRSLNILELLMQFVDFRREVVLRRSQFQLDKAKSRLHILEWLKRAIDVLDEVIDTIKESQTREEAKQNLMKKFEFSEEQTEYILMLRLQTLVGLEIQKILNEIGDREEEITYLEGIINDPAKRDGVVSDEMHYMKDKYGDERRTKVSQDPSVYELNKNIKALKKLDGLMKEPVIAWIGNDYKIKVLYQTRILNIPDDTFILSNTHNQDKMIALSNKWELVVQRLKDFGKFTTKSPALDVVKEYGIKHDLMFSITMENDFDYLVFVTNKNNVKKIKKELILKFKKFPTIVMGLEKDEVIMKVIACKEGQKIGLISEQGQMLIFREKFVRPMGKTAWWVKGMDLADWDNIADMFIYNDEPFIFLHDGKNGKMVAAEDIFELKARGEMKRGQSWVTCCPMIMGQKLVWAISMVEWAVNLVLATGRVDLLNTDKMALGMPSDGLTKITNGEIVQMYRPWAEKEKERVARAAKENEE